MVFERRLETGHGEFSLFKCIYFNLEDKQIPRAFFENVTWNLSMELYVEFKTVTHITTSRVWRGSLSRSLQRTLRSSSFSLEGISSVLKMDVKKLLKKKKTIFITHAWNMPLFVHVERAGKWTISGRWWKIIFPMHSYDKIQNSEYFCLTGTIESRFCMLYMHGKCHNIYICCKKYRVQYVRESYNPHLCQVCSSRLELHASLTCCIIYVII